MKPRRAEISSCLRRARRARWLRSALEGSVAWLGFCLPGLALLLLIGFLLPPTPIWSALAVGAAGLWSLIGFALWFLGPFLRYPSLSGYALWLEKRAGLDRNELINALALERERGRWERHPISRDLVDLSLARARERFAGLRLGVLHRGRRLLPGLLCGAAALFVLLGAWVISPVRFADSARLFLSAGQASVLPGIAIAVVPGDAKLERGCSVAIRARISGRRRPRGAEIEMRQPGAAWVRARMTGGEPSDRTAEVGEADSAAAGRGGIKRGEDNYAFLLGALSGDIEYRVHTGWGNSPVYRLHVVERLQAVGYRKVYEPPAYTGISPQREISSTGDLAAIAGTRVTLEVMHRRRGASGEIHYKDQWRSLPLAPAGSELLRGSWVLEETGSYCVELIDEVEQERWVSDTFHVEVVPDLEPSVRLLSPPEVIQIPPDMRVALEIDCVDDFGLTELALIYGRATDDPIRKILGTWDDRKEARLTFNWNLEEVHILPGQDLHYYLQVLDNDARAGPKLGETPLCTIRFPGLAEMYVQAEEDRREDIESVEDVLRGQETLRKELEKVAREMLKEDRISWEKQQEIQDLIMRQEAVAQKVEELHQSLDASQQRMENQNLFSMEMIEQLHEIQELVREVQSDEFRALVDRMRQALESLDRREMQEAMREMKLTQEEISQSLDRTLQMLRRLLAEERLDRILQKMNELEARQAEVNRQLEMDTAQAPGDSLSADAEESSDGSEERPPGSEERPPGSDQQSPGDEDEERSLSPEEAEALQAQQEAIRRELEKLQEALEELRKSSGEGLEDLAKALDEFQQDPSLRETLERMREARESMSQCSRSNALKFGRKAREGLQQMQAGLGQMSQQMDAAKAEALARALYNIANRLVRASLVQEEMVRVAERLSTREMAVREQEIHDEIDTVGDSLLQVARETPVIKRGHLRALGEILRDLERAKDLFESGRRRPAVSLAGETSRALNAATKSLLEAAANVKGTCSSSCPNPFNQMQCLSAQQNELNQQTQKLMGACQTPRLTMGQQESMMRMAARQEMIRQGLQQIQGQLESSGKLMGDLDEVIREMEEVVEELRARKAEQRIIERQERVLSRLLSAQRSIRKRDRTEERLAQTGVNPGQRPSPAWVETGRSPAERLQRAMLRGSKDPVPAEYRRMVEIYMQLLLRSR